MRKGHYETLSNGKVVDRPACVTCKHRYKMTIEYPCYNCIDGTDLALHEPSAETEFAYYEHITNRSQTMAELKKLINWWKKRRARKACGMHCGQCPFLQSHWDNDKFMGLSCRKGLW